MNATKKPAPSVRACLLLLGLGLPALAPAQTQAPTPAADQYSLGAVAYFALTGHSTYPTGQYADQRAAKLPGPPRPIGLLNPGVPLALVGVIDQMLRPSPNDRFAALNEVRNRLAVFDSHHDQPADVPPPPQTVLDLTSPSSQSKLEGPPSAVTKPRPLSLNPPRTGIPDPSPRGCGRSLLRRARRRSSWPCSAAVPRFSPRRCRARSDGKR